MAGALVLVTVVFLAVGLNFALRLAAPGGLAAQEPA